MTKRFFSLLLSMAILFTVTRPAFAAGLDSDLQEETVSLGNESVVVHYQVNGKISYIEVGSDIIEVRGNEVYLNGELIATITSTVISGDPSVIEPYTGWLYTDECSFGTPSDYTRYIKTVEHNITFEEAIEELSGDIILTILVSAVNSFATDPTGASLGFDILAGVAEDIYNWAHDYPQRTKIYALEDIYGHKNGMGYIHKNEYIYYGDRAYTQEISSKTMFSFWS